MPRNRSRSYESRPTRPGRILSTPAVANATAAPWAPLSDRDAKADPCQLIRPQACSAVPAKTELSINQTVSPVPDDLEVVDHGDAHARHAVVLHAVVETPGRIALNSKRRAQALLHGGHALEGGLAGQGGGGNVSTDSQTGGEHLLLDATKYYQVMVRTLGLARISSRRGKLANSMPGKRLSALKPARERHSAPTRTRPPSA